MPKILTLLVTAAVISVAGVLVTSQISWATQRDTPSQQKAGGASGSPASFHALPANKVYWADAGFSVDGAASVMRADFTGTPVENGASIEAVVTDRKSVNGVAVDPAGGRIYWSDNFGPFRSDLNGTTIEDLLPPLPGRSLGQHFRRPQKR
ncbi:MAG: hypothetical protein O3A33_04640 [Chloroflexi bacterium]|nr:hypothetical protein [Chloroflexota bacterium]